MSPVTEKSKVQAGFTQNDLFQYHQEFTFFPAFPSNLTVSVSFSFSILFSIAALTSHYTISFLKQHKFLSYGSGDQKSVNGSYTGTIKVSRGLLSSWRFSGRIPFLTFSSAGAACIPGRPLRCKRINLCCLSH